jgi:hypothetical protein
MQKGSQCFGAWDLLLPQHEQAEPPHRKEDFEEEDDKYHQPRWCPD